jgi:hypothetical protein
MDRQNSHSKRILVPSGSSKMVWFLGFLFEGLGGFSLVRHIYDAMTYGYLFLGLLAIAVACCLQNIEIRVAALELSLQTEKKQLE